MGRITSWVFVMHTLKAKSLTRRIKSTEEGKKQNNQGGKRSKQPRREKIKTTVAVLPGIEVVDGHGKKEERGNTPAYDSSHAGLVQHADAHGPSHPPTHLSTGRGPYTQLSSFCTSTSKVRRFATIAGYCSLPDEFALELGLLGRSCGELGPLLVYLVLRILHLLAGGLLLSQLRRGLPPRNFTIFRVCSELKKKRKSRSLRLLRKFSVKPTPRASRQNEANPTVEARLSKVPPKEEKRS